MNPIERNPSQIEQQKIEPFRNVPVIVYLTAKCDLIVPQIQQRLKNGGTFQIKGQGNDLDNRLIQQVLIQNDFYQKLNIRGLKDQALRFVKGIVQDWSLNIAKNQKKINKDQLPMYTAKVLPFGSHVLDLKSNSSDIDLVCVVPNFINRQTHFFDQLAFKFEQSIGVKGLSVIRSAKVPIITFDYLQINIDISFCKLEDQMIPRDIQRVINMDLINKIKDQKSKTSIMGRKNNLMILQLAGIGQLQNFKTTLRIIKVWAKNRGISSNAMGFLGGISWAIMLAKICQIFPNHKPSKLLSQFFNIYKLWRWKQMPVALTAPSAQALQAQASLKQKVMMTVFTPGNHYNSTVRVNKIIFEIIDKQINRASELLNYKRGDYRTLVQKIDFFGSYDFFVQIDICGASKTRQEQKQYKDFLGSIESKILNLLNSIINHNKKDLEKGLKIIPNPKSFKKTDPRYEICNSFFLGIKMTAPADLTRAVSQWCVLLQKQRLGKQHHLNVHIFECTRQDFANDVDINQIPKKVEKQDPRLAMRAKKN